MARRGSDSELSHAVPTGYRDRSRGPVYPTTKASIEMAEATPDMVGDVGFDDADLDRELARLNIATRRSGANLITRATLDRAIDSGAIDASPADLSRSGYPALASYLRHRHHFAASSGFDDPRPSRGGRVTIGWTADEESALRRSWDALPDCVAFAREAYSAIGSGRLNYGDALNKARDYGCHYGRVLALRGFAASGSLSSERLDAIYRETRDRVNDLTNLVREVRR